MKRGIFLVANRRSQRFCENSVYSIRRSGCRLPVRLIHFGGEKINSVYLKNEVEFLEYENFPADAKQFIAELQTVLTDCPMGFLFRYLAWFSDWDEFIYSDNDVVALCDWERLFDYLPNHDLVHADEEYKTGGEYNYDKPEKITELFGKGALETGFTAGHFVARRSLELLGDIRSAIRWFQQHPDVPKKHDQALLHVASLLGNWQTVNLCKPPHNWLSSWAGDYKTVLELVLALQNGNGAGISHIHYSGGEPSGLAPIDEFLFAHAGSKKRLHALVLNGCMQLSGIRYLQKKRHRLVMRLKNPFQG